MICNITNYESVKLLEPCLLVLDIDNTIIKMNGIHKTWWEETKNKYEKIYCKEVSDKLALSEWNNIIKTRSAELIDKDSFIQMMNNILYMESKVIFITARDKSLKDDTMRHLIECGLNVLGDDVYHSYPKGEKLLEIYNQKYKHLQNIIFVDDDINNIEDVAKHMKHLNLVCYHLQHEKLM